MKKLIIFCLTLLTTISTSVSASDNDVVVISEFDYLFWHEYNRYTLMTIDSNKTVEKLELDSSGSRLISPNREYYNIRFIKLILDVESGAKPWYSCRLNEKFIGHSWSCEIHIKDMDEMRTADWSHRKKHITKTGSTTRLN
jgi:hypothetical protein